jgi:hypothetical protein
MGTVGARAARENWSRQRRDFTRDKNAMISPEQRAEEIAKVVSEARLATLHLEARAALELAKKNLAAVQGNSIELQTLEDLSHGTGISPKPLAYSKAGRAIRGQTTRGVVLRQ